MFTSNYCNTRQELNNAQQCRRRARVLHARPPIRVETRKGSIAFLLLSPACVQPRGLLREALGKRRLDSTPAVPSGIFSVHGAVYCQWQIDKVKACLLMAAITEWGKAQIGFQPYLEASHTVQTVVLPTVSRIVIVPNVAIRGRDSLEGERARSGGWGGGGRT